MYIHFSSNVHRAQQTEGKQSKRKRKRNSKVDVILLPQRPSDRGTDREQHTMEAPKPLFQILLLFLLVSAYPNAFIHTALAEGVTPEEARQLRDEVNLVESHPETKFGFFIVVLFDHCLYGNSIFALLFLWSLIEQLGCRFPAW